MGYEKYNFVKVKVLRRMHVLNIKRIKVFLHVQFWMNSGVRVCCGNASGVVVLTVMGMVMKMMMVPWFVWFSWLERRPIQ